MSKLFSETFDLTNSGTSRNPRDLSNFTNYLKKHVRDFCYACWTAPTNFVSVSLASP